MKRRAFIKTAFSFSLLSATLGLSACGEQLIRPDDKQVLAMLQFEMPDYEPTNENVLKKVQQWMSSQPQQSTNKMTFVSSNAEHLSAKGVVSVPLKGKFLKVAFNVEINAVNPNLIRFEATQFKDLPGPLEGESDNASVFFNQVKDQVLTLCDSLENYLGDDVGNPLANFKQKDLI